MPAEKSAPDLAEELSQARVRIAELEAANARLRLEQGTVPAAAMPSPSLILDSITDAFVAVDSHYRYIWVNAEAERSTRMSRDQFLGHTMWELFPEVVGTAVEQKVRQALTERIPIEFESFYAPWQRWISNKAYPTKEGGLAVYWRDITEQKRLQAERDRQGLVLEQVHDAIISADLAGNITNWNRGAAKIFGYESEEVLGRHVSILYFEEDRPHVGSFILEPLLRDGQSEVELRNRRKDGDECYIRLSLSLLRDQSNQPYGMLGVSTDITAQKRAEKLYRCLVDAMPQIAYVTGPDGKATLVNRFWETYSGIPAEQSLDFNWLSFVHPLDVTEHQARWIQAIENGGAFESEYRLRRADGAYRWHLVRAIPIRDSQGAITQWVGTSTDIHERKTAEESLRIREERFRLASEAVQGIVYDWNLLTGVVDRSGNLESILGIAVSEAEPTTEWWQQRVHRDDTAETSLLLAPLAGNDRNSFETEFRVRHVDGHWVHAAERGFIIRDEHGVPVRVVGSTHNISERKRLEKELQEKNKRLKFQADILDTTNDAVVAVDPNLNIRYCNAAAERMYGISLSEVIGKPLSALHSYAWLTPEDEERYLTALRQHGIWRGEYIHILNDGSRLVVNCTVNVLAPESGGGMVSVIRDVTGRKRAEIQAQNQASQLARANQDLLHFAYAVSHDLQAPVRTVSAFSQLLALRYKPKLDEDGAEFISLIADASARMTTMIRDLLRFAKVAGSDIQLSEAVLLEEVLATALANLRSEIDETSAVVTRDILPSVSGDANQFLHLFQNLIGNALKYRKPDQAPRIHIAAERKEESWIFHVRDNGVGFDPRQADRIFRVFERLQTDAAGTGMGLTICRRIVERRGGRIWADGKPGVGAVLSFSIPDSTDAVQAAPALPADVLRAVAGQQPPPNLEHFDELFRSLDLAQCIVRDLEGKILIWTQGAERLFGWSKNEAIGRPAHELLRTRFPKPLPEIEADLLRSGEWSGQLQKLTREGGAIWLASHWALYRDGSGRPQSVIEVNNDITTLKIVEEALRRSTEQRDLALRAGHMGIWSWDRRSGKVEWDQTVEALLGMKPGSFEGTYEAFHARIHPQDVAHHDACIREAFESGPEYGVETRVRHNDGSYRWWRGQGQAILEQGVPVGISGVVWEITSRKHAELDSQFLLDLSAQLTRLSDRRQMADLAVAEVGTFLGLIRCSFIDIDFEAGCGEVIADYRVDGPPALGPLAVDAFAEANSEPSADGVLTIRQISAETRVVSLGIARHEESFWRAYIRASYQKGRSWQAREVAVLGAVAERLWPLMENARLLALTKAGRKQFEATFEQAAVGMAHVDLTGRWLRVNRRICEITGYTKEELLASRFQDITHPDDLEADLNRYEALQRGEFQSYSIEKRYFHKNGSLIWVNLTVALVRDDSGVPNYAISVIEDITTRKKTSRSLQETNAVAALRLREIEAIYSQAPVGLVFLDTDLRFVRINDYLAKINGRSIEQTIGRTIDEVLPDLGPRLSPILRKAIETRKPILELEIRGIAPGRPGVECTWLISYLPLHGENGNILGIHGVVQDITERKRAPESI